MDYSPLQDTSLPLDIEEHVPSSRIFQSLAEWLRGLPLPMFL